MTQTWLPSLGAWPAAEGVTFQVWAPAAATVELVFEGGMSARPPLQLEKSSAGMFKRTVADLRPGTRYRYRIDGRGPFPDPVSRFQPDGVHGPSEVIDPAGFEWSDAGWTGVPADRLVIYELHVGTFTRPGTFAAAAEMLPQLAELGINCIELMPLADFPGQRGWGYDGVSLFAPARCYGRPDDLRRLADTAHRLGIAVLLDVVYNHLGPDGNYLGQFSPFYFSTTHHTGWGTGPNFDGEHCREARAFFIENALYWVHEYHFDGLRLDATHAILDDSEPNILAELTERLHAAGERLGRHVVAIAEDERNLDILVRSRPERGFGMDAVWSDDLHHELHCTLTGEHDGYYAAYTGMAADIAETIRKGWFYCGQATPGQARRRGTEPGGIPPHKFVVCIQNHDQIGNRAFGERLNQEIDPSAYRAASALLLTVPETPLLFMGQEWAASSPFLYFTDHNPELGALVTEGRRKEFGHFTAFSDPHVRSSIPDPQARSTFEVSKLNWDERDREPHAGMLRLYRDLLRLRANEPAFQPGGSFNAAAIAKGAVLLRRGGGEEGMIVLAALRPGVVAAMNEPGWSVLLTTEDESYASSPRPPMVSSDETGTVVHFPCPAAVVFQKAIE